VVGPAALPESGVDSCRVENGDGAFVEVEAELGGAFDEFMSVVSVRRERGDQPGDDVVGEPVQGLASTGDDWLSGECCVDIGVAVELHGRDEPISVCVGCVW